MSKQNLKNLLDRRKKSDNCGVIKYSCRDNYHFHRNRNGICRELFQSKNRNASCSDILYGSICDFCRSPHYALV